MATPFIPRAVFGTLDSLPKTYYLGHHAAGLAKMRRMLNQIDIVIECRDSRIPLTSQNPMFEEALADKPRLLVYTKKDLVQPFKTDKDEKVKLLRRYLSPSQVHFSDVRSGGDVRALLRLLREHTANSGQLMSHCMVAGMPNVGKSTLLNALRQSGVHKGKAARTGAQPGITRKIGTGVKILEGDEDTGDCPVYIIDTPGVFIPYVPDGEAILKFALCGSVKDTIIAPSILADYLMFHINHVDPSLYADYHPPTNEVMQLLTAMAKRTGRLQKGGTADIDATALWFIQRWRNGHFGHFMLDNVTEDAIALYEANKPDLQSSRNQAIKAGKRAIRDLAAQRARSRLEAGTA